MWGPLGIRSYLRAAEAQADAAAAEARSDAVGRRADDIEREAAMRAERHALVIQAMWETLRDHLGLTDEMLRKKMHEIDLRDGFFDGRITLGAAPCRQCGRPVRSDRLKCMMCGHQNPPRTIAS